ncbi:MAG: glycoside hydrolase family 57 protein [Desulfurococcaceae archaeon]
MSLVNRKIINGLESYIVLNKPVYLVGEKCTASVLIKSIEYSGFVEVIILDHDNNIVYKSNYTITQNESRAENIDISIPSKPGQYSLKLKINNNIVDTVDYIVIESISNPFYIALVWHNHQAPNYLPNNIIHAPWAYIYVYGNQLQPYGRGPYAYHTDILSKYSSYKCTFNLSPSLLYQWYLAISNGVVFHNGDVLKPGSDSVEYIREILNRYIDFAKKERIDVLTSIYGHTIGGYLIDVLNIQDIVFDEVKYGKEITMKILDGYEPIGAWTPEMAFSMKMIDIYYDNGIEYTVLDDTCHFDKAIGEKGSKYEPYIVYNKDSGKYLFVVFRDHYLSDLIGFKNNFYSDIHAYRNAYESMLIIVRKILESKPKVLTIALDGENWLVFSHNPPLVAYFYDRLVNYLEVLAKTGFIKTVHLREVFDQIPAKRILTHIPTASWLCGFKKWRGERVEHEQYWRSVSEIIRLIRVYENTIGGRDEYSEKARWAIWHALDSDYWWSEFWLPKIIETWIREAQNIVFNRLSKIRVRDIAPIGEFVEKQLSRVKCIVDNELEKSIKLDIMLNLVGCSETIKNSVKIPGKTSVEIVMDITPCLCGESLIVATLYSDNYILNTMYKKIKIQPYIGDINT